MRKKEEILELHRQISLLQKELDIQKQENQKLISENAKIKNKLKYEQAKNSGQLPPVNSRLAGRKKHNDQWIETYKLLKPYYQKYNSYSDIKKHMGGYIEGLALVGHDSSITLKKFSRSTYYRYKKIFSEESDL